MSTTYTGNGLLVPSPVTIQRPADTDYWNSATLFTDQYQLVADIGARVQIFQDGYLSFKSIFVDGIGGQIVDPSFGDGDGYFIGSVSVIEDLAISGDVGAVGNVGIGGYLSVGTPHTLSSGSIRASGNLTIDGYTTLTNLVTNINGISSAGTISAVALSSSGLTTASGGLITNTLTSSGTNVSNHVWGDLQPIATGYVTATSTTPVFSFQRNMASISKSGTGVYSLVMKSTINTPYAIQVTPVSSGGTGWGQATFTNGTTFAVSTQNPGVSGGATVADLNFSFVVFGAF